MRPRLAMCNFLHEVGELREFALKNGFTGIDWSFDPERIPQTPLQESRWVKEQSKLSPLEVRYHCPFDRMDLGHEDLRQVAHAEGVFRRVIRLASKAGGRYLSIHVGLGIDSTEPLSWESTLNNLTRLVRFGAGYRIRVCLENLAWGWTSKPNLFEKLIRLSGAGVTLDLGHAHACEAVRSRQYSVEDFVAPHADRLYNAHVYQTEIPGIGHVPPDNVDEIADGLSLLVEAGCEWWVIEIREQDGLLKTKEITEAFLANGNASRPLSMGPESSASRPHGSQGA